MKFNVDDIIHPEDASAIKTLKALPGFDKLAKYMMAKITEEMMHSLNMGSHLRLGPNQYPEIYNMLVDVCGTLGISPVPELYLQLDRQLNACTYGDSRMFIVVNSGLLESVTHEEIKAVIAHECGHIVCRHVLYHNLANTLVNGSSILLPDIATEAIRLALFRWTRLSELSADRVSALALGSNYHIEELLRRFCGAAMNIPGFTVNKEEYDRQLEDFERIASKSWSKTMQNLAVMSNSHPLTAVRMIELRRWVSTPQFERLVNELQVDRYCPSCGNKLPKDGVSRWCRKCGNPL